MKAQRDLCGIAMQSLPPAWRQQYEFAKKDYGSEAMVGCFEDAILCLAFSL